MSRFAPPTLRATMLALAHLIPLACVDKDDSPTSTTFPLDPSPGSSGAADDGDDPSSSEATTVTTAAPSCGDGTCDLGESCASCESDCNVCPDVCGDGQCTANESCGSCEADCGICCGNGTCDATAGEDWAVCWRDCSDEAPMLPFADVYGGCAGATTIADGEPADEFLWVRSDTHEVMYAAGDTVAPLDGLAVDGNQLVSEGVPLASIVCHHEEGVGCTLRAAEMVFPDTGGEQVPCLFGHLELLDFSFDGAVLDSERAGDFQGCATLCGNGQCDPHETACAPPSTSNDCPGDCGEPDGCPACA